MLRHLPTVTFHLKSQRVLSLSNFLQPILIFTGKGSTLKVSLYGSKITKRLAYLSVLSEIEKNIILTLTIIVEKKEKFVGDILKKI